MRKGEGRAVFFRQETRHSSKSKIFSRGAVNPGHPRSSSDWTEQKDSRMKLFGFKGTRSNRVEWMLQEKTRAGLRLVKVNLLSGEHKKPDHVKRHGHGLVPALEDGDVRIDRMAAACLYLADKHLRQGACSGH